jgi:putative transposase
MAEVVEVYKQYKYRMYQCDKKDRALRHKIFVASTIWNHFIALQRRYYNLSGKYITLYQMRKHVLKLRRTERFSLWMDLHSQVCQDVVLRVEDAYLRFFKGLANGRPKFKKAVNYSSFTFPQSGYKLNGNTVTMDGVKYKFVLHREIKGQVKALTVKRDRVGRLWFVFRVLEKMVIGESSTGKSGGFDFGLKTFLVDDENRYYSSPQYFRQNIRKTRKLNRELSRKVQGSHRYKRARRALAKHSADVANKRLEHHYQLAHDLCNEYAVMCFEDLNINGMKAVWGRKVSDLGFSSFMNTLEWVALKRGKEVRRIDRWERSTGKCSSCGHLQNLELRDRVFHCENCTLIIGRDHNAARNIFTIGTSMDYQSVSKTKVRLRSRVDGRSPQLSSALLRNATPA